MVQRLVECRRRVSPVDAFAVPDQQVLRLEPAERVARRREPEQQVNAGPIRRRREEPVRADRLGDDERRGRPATRAPSRASARCASRRRPRMGCPEPRPERQGAGRRARPRPRRSRGCAGRAAEERRAARRLRGRGRARARGGQGRRARRSRRPQAHATSGSRARRRSTRSRMRRGRRRSGCSSREATRPTGLGAERPQPPPGAPRCPWCHASGDLVTGVCRLRAAIRTARRRPTGLRGALRFVPT